ncbi:MAG: hypothetical protein OEY44_04930, partial [Candidatus Peregrinibacteria bacterium]|nr:hypothetical protein [Candidatus Peregrinibacteria bacterium]
ELLVSVGITAILMLGMATFFSSTFQNMFAAREEVGASQGQFVVNTILTEKFRHVQALASGGEGAVAIIQNDTSQGDLPFTYISAADGRMVFKDFLVYNRSGAGLPAIPGAGLLVDMTDNGQEGGGLVQYVTDAEAGIVWAVTTSGATAAIENLDFPTGIAYAEYGEAVYLFVAESYQNRVLKIKLSDPDNSRQVVVGGGDDTVCDPSDDREHSAFYCKLNFPTGLLIADGALFISDTGNGRVLRVDDPTPDLSNLALPMNLSVDTQISHVDFVFPEDTTIDSVEEGDGGNDLHKVKYTSDTNIASATLSAETSNNYIVSVDLGGDPPATANYFRGFYTDAQNAIFDDGDELFIVEENSAHTVSSISGLMVNTLPSNSTITPNIPSTVRITKEFLLADSPYSFHLNLGDTTLPSGFQPVKVEAFDYSEEQVNEPTDMVTLRVGDEVLGTFEDTISVVGVYDYPTGLRWGSELTVEELGQLSESPSSYEPYDYISDFEIQSFAFDTLLSGALLELKFDARLKSDEAGENPVNEWVSYQLNAAIPQP